MSTHQSLMVGQIHPRIADEISRYEQRERGGLTHYTRAEVEAAYAELQAADAEMTSACKAAEAVLAPRRVSMGIWQEIGDERYCHLEALTFSDVPWAQAGKLAEMYPLSEWAKAAASWRGLAQRIRRELARLEVLV